MANCLSNPTAYRSGELAEQIAQNTSTRTPRKAGAARSTRLGTAEFLHGAPVQENFEQAVCYWLT